MDALHVVTLLNFHGKQWTADPGECRLTVALPLNGSSHAGGWWSLEIGARPNAAPRSRHRELRLSVHPLFLPAKSWRDLENTEVKVDALWQNMHEFVNEDGEVQCSEAELQWWPEPNTSRAGYWLSDEFHLRFGSRDGCNFVCELETALKPEKDYFLDPPAIRASDACSPSELLLVLGQATLSRCEVEVPAGEANPGEWARARAERELGLRMFEEVKVDARRVILMPKG